jgi:hypothetical protein
MVIMATKFHANKTPTAIIATKFDTPLSLHQLVPLSPQKFKQMFDARAGNAFCVVRHKRQHHATHTVRCLFVRFLCVDLISSLCCLLHCCQYPWSLLCTFVVFVWVIDLFVMFVILFCVLNGFLIELSGKWLRRHFSETWHWHLLFLSSVHLLTSHFFVFLSNFGVWAPRKCSTPFATEPLRKH